MYVIYFHNILAINHPGVGLKNKWHQGSHLFNSKGVFLRHFRLQLQKGVKCVFTVIKELKGLLWWVSPRKQPSIVWYCYALKLLKGMISTWFSLDWYYLLFWLHVHNVVLILFTFLTRILKIVCLAHLMKCNFCHQQVCQLMGLAQQNGCT